MNQLSFKNGYLQFCLFIIFLFPVFLLSCDKTSTRIKKPNIVFIIADDLSWKHIGSYGCKEIHTPYIDKLGKEGVIFDNAFVSVSSCTPSRASILTGRNGFELEEGASLWGYLPAKFTTYTEILAQNGYIVGATGKGWAPGFLIDRDVNPAGKPYNQIRQKPFKEFSEKIAISDIDYSSNLDLFLDSLNKDQPFCFWVGTFEPHRGYTQGLAAFLGINAEKIQVPVFMPDVKEVREDIAEYYAEVQYIDMQVGRMLEILKNHKRLDNTLIIFTSDNGMPFPRAKATCYDYGTHMPLIVWWGKHIQGGRRISDMISFTDFAPTFLDAAGINIPAEMSGKSFLTLLRSKKSGQIDLERKKVYLYRERHAWSYKHGETFPMRAIRTDQYLFIWNINPDSLPRDVDGGPAKKYMIDHKDQYAELYDLSFGKRKEFELYNVKTDSFQMHNLAYDPAYADVLKSLKNELLTYLKERKDPRMFNNSDVFRYTPYFGILFQTGLLKWTPEQQGQNLSFEERRELLQKAYSMIDEDDFFKEMVRRQKGKL